MPPLQCYCPAPLHYSNIKTPYYCNNKFKGILYFYLVIFLHSRLLIIFNRVVLIFPTLATPAILRFLGLFYTEDYSSMPPFCSILNTFTISPYKIKFPSYMGKIIKCIQIKIHLHAQLLETPVLFLAWLYYFFDITFFYRDILGYLIPQFFQRLFCGVRTLVRCLLQIFYRFV